MDVPPKFAIPLLLVAALPAGFAGLHFMPASSSVAPVATRAVRVPAPAPVWHQDEAALARQADEAIAIGRARQAAAQAERDAADFELARMRTQMRDQKTAGEVFRALGDAGPTDPKRLKEEEERRDHANAVYERTKLDNARAKYCANSRWHCERP
jgi:hypothetical protein